jgi:hypothetical protein
VQKSWYHKLICETEAPIFGEDCARISEEKSVPKEPMFPEAGGDAVVSGS